MYQVANTTKCRRDMAVLLCQFVLVRKHAVATIDIAPGEWLWGPLKEVGPHLGFVSHRSVKPGFRQGIDWKIDPGGAKDRGACAKIFYRGGAERRPTPLLRIGALRQRDRCLDQFIAAVLGVVKPLVQEIAQRDPRLFPLTDVLEGRSHRVEMISRVHHTSSWSQGNVCSHLHCTTSRQGNRVLKVISRWFSCWTC